ncbi:MAG: ABC transporter ATP-binding protein [Oscillospiraceae bacterium]|jgi:iron complex transport system ATP-binding protein|nr:ABC transporter ATP-binding protein [Oscillospiraceae bacterium]
MLSARNINVSYGSTQVVFDVSFDVMNNANLCVLGPNGCGKTTLLKAVAGILPHGGTVAIDDRDTRTMKRREVSLKIALMSQSQGVYFSYSVFDAVMMGRYLHIKDGILGSPSGHDRDFVAECLRSVGLLDVAKKEISQLSGGQLQRVFFARTLAQEPQIILLDEPTNHLDMKYQIELIEYLREWSSHDNHSVIGVLHDINLAMRLSENMLILKEGRIAASGVAGAQVTTELLRDVYGVDVVGFMRESLGKWEGISAQ